jgi:hypothetical protein
MCYAPYRANVFRAVRGAIHCRGFQRDIVSEIVQRENVAALFTEVYRGRIVRPCQHMSF